MKSIRIPTFIAVVLLYVTTVGLLPAELTYSSSATAPTIDGTDIANLVGGDTLGGGDDANWIYGNRPSQGQTFTTGSNPTGYDLSAVTIQRASGGTTSWSGNNVTDFTYGLRIDMPSGTDLSATDLLNDTTASIAARATTSAGGNLVTDPAELDYVTLSGFSVHLDPDTTYSFDVVVPSGVNQGWRLDANTDTNSYTGGTAFSTGDDGIPSDTLVERGGDRVFHLNLNDTITTTLPLSLGDVIKLDLGTAGDADGTPGATADWNQVAGSNNITIGAGSVIRHGDAAVIDGVTINVNTTGNPGQANDANAAGWSGLAGDPYYNDEAFTDLIYGWGPGNLTVTFGGLDPTLSYNLRTYALINEGSADFALTVTDGGSNIVRTNLNRSALYATAPLSSDLIFEGISPDGSGSIAATISSGDGVSFEAAVLEAVVPTPFLLGVDYDPVTGMLMFSWNSRPGKVYDLLSATAPSGDPATWPVVTGAEGLLGNAHTMARPPEDVRFFVLRERTDPVQAHVLVDTETPAKAYDPMIFGGFLEHFHKQVYGGVFEPGSPLADGQGFRTDVIAALQELQVPVIRWPGGIFVDDYFWEWGVGGSRQGYLDGAWGVWEPNTFGTHEFIELCERLGAVPYIANNGKGPIEDMENWVEYTNATTGTYASLRQANGETDPFPVPIWSVGNENYSGDFAAKVRDAAIAMKAVDPSIQVTAPALIGTIGTLLGTAGDHLDLISIHDYSFANFQTFHRPTYLQAIAESEDADGYIAAAVAQIELAGYRGLVKIAFDEWNLRSWHHPGFPWGDPNNQAQIDARDISLDPSLYTMADALHTASFFNACLRHADDMAMANIAPLVNQSGPLYVHPGGIVKRTHFHTFAMYAQHLKSKVVDSQVSSPILAGASVSLVDAIVTTDDNLNYMLALVNRDPALPVTCRMDIPGLTLDGVFNATVLAGDSPDSYNDVANPDRVAPEEVQLQFVNGVVTLPPHSLTVVHVGN